MKPTTSSFPIMNASSAPEASQPILQTVQKKMGMVPNLIGTFAASPATLQAYSALSAAFDSSSLTAEEKQVVLITTSVVNNCSYCVAAHSTISAMQKINPATISALRQGTAMPTPKLEALRSFTRLATEQRGQVGDAAVASIIGAGYTSAQVMEILIGISLKTLTNYTNSVAHTPLDAAFEPQQWSANAKAA